MTLSITTEPPVPKKLQTNRERELEGQFGLALAGFCRYLTSYDVWTTRLDNAARAVDAVVKPTIANVAAAALLLAVLGTASALLCSSHASLHPRCGLLPSRQDPFLDNSGRCFQKISWHLGNATRTWGEAYGVKLGRVYLTLGVKHINPRVTAKEANEGD